MGKIIVSGRDTRHKILNGISKLENAVAKTYGPFGRTVVFAKGASSRITKDGISVAEQISFSDEIENMGAQLIREAARKANAVNGDGSSLTTILTGEFCKELNTLLDFNADVNQIRQGFNYAKELVLNELEKYKTEFQTENNIKQIASVSSNNDPEITKYITEAFTSIGDKGIVAIADSLSREGKTKVVLSSGLEFDKGFASGASVNTNHDSCELENPYVLISSKPFEEYKDLAIILQVIEKTGRPVIIMCPSFTEEVVAGFTELLKDKRMQGAMVLIPGLSKRDIFDRGKDISVMTGSKYIFEDIDLDSFYPDDHCGSAASVKVTRNKTFIFDPKYDEKEFNDYIESLEKQVALDDADEGLSNAEIDTIKERIAMMSGGIATIRIGALNELELGEKHDRYEDAVNAVRSAMRYGMVPGAGTALAKISYKLMNDFSKIFPVELNTMQKQNAARAFLNVIRKPAKMLIQSSGNDHEEVISQVIKQENRNVGFNARTGECVDLVETGVVDPYNVIKNAVIYSASVADVFISLDLAIISDIKNMSINNTDPLVNPDGFNCL